MTRPSKDNIRVSLDALRYEADRWELVSAQLARVQDYSANLQRRPGLEFGIFFGAYGDYDAACVKLAEVTAGGRDETLRIATTLQAVAKRYAAEEEKNAKLGTSIHEKYKKW
ncbi:MAG: hypothetical protein L0G99_11185 [Propionibacteriales bacterium]|nr:hypothetical protein [Propionibacteriales bacterium]